MVISELLKTIGIPVVVRNIMVDYFDKNGQFYHKPLQSISPQGEMESDMELTERIKSELWKQGFIVCGIQEVTGDFDMNQLESVFNGNDYGKHPVRVIYIDVEKAVR